MDTWNNRGSIDQFVEIVLSSNAALRCPATGRSFTGSSVRANVFSPNARYDELAASFSRSAGFACHQEARAFAQSVADEYGLSFDHGNTHRSSVWSARRTRLGAGRGGATRRRPAN